MNKELIKKYKPEFEHWLNDGELLILSLIEKKWIQLNVKCWSLSEDRVIIINDEYVELRKALAEGKTIQHISATTGEWVDFNKGFEPTPSYTFLTTPEYYRIKPDKPKFKVGDWVRLKIFGKTVHKITGLYYHNYYKGFHPTLSNFNGNIDTEESLELWQPKKGEWCWFWDNPRVPVLDKFEKFGSQGAYCLEQYSAMKFCEPFIGELPSHLKVQ